MFQHTHKLWWLAKLTIYLHCSNYMSGVKNTTLSRFMVLAGTLGVILSGFTTLMCSGYTGTEETLSCLANLAILGCNIYSSYTAVTELTGRTSRSRMAS